MGNKVSVKASGLAELDKALEELGNEVAGRLLYSALTAAAKPMLAEAVARAPIASGPHYRYKRQKIRKVKRTGNKITDRYNREMARSEARRAPAEKTLVQPGNLRKNIASQRLRGKKNMKTTKGNAVVALSWRGDAYYGRFLEVGTKHIAPRSFMRDAFAAKQTEALEIFKARLARGVDLARRRIASQQGIKS